MSDIYVPGIKSRFNTDQLVESLMKVERIPLDRAEKNVERLQTEKTYWQDMGRRMSALRDSARYLYSFQNPFNDRIVTASEPGVITGTATREAAEQERSFTVKQIAQADRFLSSPQDDSFRVEPGDYRFSLGDEEIAFNYRGGTLKDFADTLTSRGRDKIQASLVTVRQGSKSLLIESKITGEGKDLGFSGSAEKLAVQIGMVERLHDSRRDIPLGEDTVRENSGSPGQSLLSFGNNTLEAAAGGSATIPLAPGLRAAPNLVLKFETATRVLQDLYVAPQPPSGPAIPSAGSVSYGGIVIENDASKVPIPPWTPPEAPPHVDDMGALSLSFSDGTTAQIPPIRDSEGFSAVQYPLSSIAGDKTITAINLVNNNTHRDISIRNIEVFDPNAPGGLRPLNAVSRAQDAVVAMEGVEVHRPSNTIDDLIPGVTITALAPSSRPVTLGVAPDREAIKDSIISLVGNYNRLMAEINVLTRTDDRVVEELTYLSTDEQGELKKRLGALSGDSSLNQIRSTLQRATSSPYPTALGGNLTLLAQIGIGTDVRRATGSTGYDAARLRGYLEIDEKVLDNALQTKMEAVKQLFGSDTDGDLMVDTGVAHALETLSKPYVEAGGIIALKTGTVDSRVSQEERRIETLDRQLASKEAALKNQYSQMESAYSNMERMSTSLDNFSRQQSGSNNNR